MKGGVESIKFLSCSQARSEILRRLRQQDRLTERELREQLDCSRTTVHRNLTALQEQDWIMHADGQYAITTCGEFMLEKFTEMTNTAETTSKLQPFLQWVPRNTLDFDVTLLRDAEVTVGKSNNPLAMVNRQVQKLKETTEFRAVLPLTALHPYEVQHHRMLQGQLEAEHVVSPSVAETFQSDPDFADLTRGMLDSDQFDIYVYDGDIPYYLGILDETVQLGADKEGVPHALVETTADEVRTWAEAKYSDYKQSAYSLQEARISLMEGTE